MPGSSASLDEATSEIDSESERLIQNSLAVLLENRTTFIIAHRFATVLNADRILVLDEGRIADSGIHSVLYNRCRIYRDLCAKQFIGESADAGGVIPLVDEVREAVVSVSGR